MPTWDLSEPFDDTPDTEGQKNPDLEAFPESDLSYGESL